MAVFILDDCFGDSSPFRLGTSLFELAIPLFPPPRIEITMDFEDHMEFENP